MVNTAQMESTISTIQAEIDAMLRRRVPAPIRKLRRLALTDANIRRVFGVSTEQLFRILAEKLGYELVMESD